MEGDIVLRKIAARITDALRNDDVIARVESDEFIVLINDVSEKTDISGIADTIRRNVSQKIKISTGDNVYVPHCRIGNCTTLKGAKVKATLISLSKASLK